MDSLRRLIALPVNSMLNKEADNAILTISELQNCKNFLAELESDCLINVYPNPAVDRIYIHIPEKQNFELQIFNILGECIVQKELSSGSNKIDISSLAKGIYVVQLTSANRTFQQKLIKA